MNKLIKNEEWYEKLIEDVRNFEVDWIILGKWKIGDRLKLDIEKFGKPEYGSKRMENLAKDLDISKVELYRCLQLREKFHSVKQLPKKSWNYIANHILPLPRREPENEPEPLPKGKYNIILADPPWNFWGGGHKNQSQHYDTLTIDKLSSMEVEKLAADDCIIFLWATFPILPEAIELLHQWGFNYATVGFVWVKPTKKDNRKWFWGLGYWTRSNTEICLIGTKGSIERKSASVHQIICEPPREHSRKPDVVREKIVELVGDLPRIELFARQKVEGWDAYGKEI